MKEYQLYDNKRLLELLAKSDELAFTEIYNRFWQKLFVIAYNRLKKISVAEDIVHDVFASLWINRNRANIILLDNYLATVTKYMVLGTIKKEFQERVYIKTALPSRSPEVHLESSLNDKLLLAVVKNEVERLPEKCRLIFKYSRYEGMAVRAIANKLSISPKTVENQLGKALKQLKLVTKTILGLF